MLCDGYGGGGVVKGKGSRSEKPSEICPMPPSSSPRYFRVSSGPSPLTLTFEALGKGTGVFTRPNCY